MLKISKALIPLFLAVCLCCSAHAAFALTTISELVENASSLDSTQVAIEGETLGEALERGNYAWINIGDGTNAIGVWVERSQIAQIEYYGDYKHKGDTVKITGVFNKSCAEHNGEVDIHCTGIDVVEHGYTVHEEIASSRVIAAVILFITACAVAAVYIKLVKKPRESEPTD